MIQLDGKTQTIHFPKNTDGWGPFTLTFHSELSQRNYTFENLSDEGSRGYLTFTINSSNIAPGEYNYSILDYDDNEVGKGLAVCDIEESNPTVKYYEINATVKEYVPKYRPVEPMKLFLPEEFIAYTATTIPYKMVSAIPWAMTVYLDGGQVGQTIFGESGTTEGEIEITQNLTNENRTYEFAYGDEDGEYAFSAYATQSGLPFSVSIFTPDEVPASATSIPFEVRYSEWNTMRTGVVSLFKNGEKVQEMPYGMYPLVFASAFTIDANATYEEIHYRLEVKTIETPIYESVSAYTECVQLANEQPSYISITAPAAISYSSTSFSYSIESNKPCTIQFYKDNVYMGQTTTEGSYEGTFHISSNTGETDITYTISGSTNDGQATDSTNVVQGYQIISTMDVESEPTIAWYDTQLPFSATTNTTGTISAFLNGEFYNSTPILFPGQIAGYFPIPTNTGSTDITWLISGETSDGTASDSATTTQNWNSATGYSDMRFTVIMLEDGDIYCDWNKDPYSEGINCRYNLNPNGVDQNRPIVDGIISGLTAGDILEFYVMSDSPGGRLGQRFSATGRHIVYGNIMSLLYVDFKQYDTAEPQNCFQSVFQGDDKLVSAENLILPKGRVYTFQQMFENCTSLENPPQLPSYSGIIGGYRWMFKGCTRLTTAPDINLKLIPTDTCEQMFYGCANLKYVKCLATSISTSNGTTNWLYGVSPTGTFVKASGMNDWTSGASGIPNGWTIQNE